MYKNLIIAEGNQEVMIAFKSLPLSSIVVDSNGHLIDVNQRAIKMFGLTNPANCKQEIDAILSDIPELPDIIEKLSRGIDVEYKTTALKRPGGLNMPLTFNASMLYGNPRIFLFQFM